MFCRYWGECFVSRGASIVFLCVGVQLMCLCRSYVQAGDVIVEVNGNGLLNVSQSEVCVGMWEGVWSGEGWVVLEYGKGCGLE